MDADRNEPMQTEELKSRILEAIRRHPSPVRRTVAIRTMLVLLSAGIAPALALIVLHAWDPTLLTWDPFSRPKSLVASTSAGALVIAITAATTAVGRGGRMLGRARQLLLFVAAGAPVAFVVWKLMLSQQYAGMTIPWSTRSGLRCFWLTLLLASCPMLAFAFIRRRSDPVHPRSLGAALGVAAGLYAGVLVDLWCPVGYAQHVLLGHALPVAVLGLTGALIGHHVLAVRSN
jgi:hypothetical protein